MLLKNQNFFDYLIIQFGMAMQNEDTPQVLNVFFLSVLNEMIKVKALSSIRKEDIIMDKDNKLFILTQLTDLSQSKLIVNRLKKGFPEIKSSLIIPMNIKLKKNDIVSNLNDLLNLDTTDYEIEIFDWKHKKRNNWIKPGIPINKASNS